MSVPTGLLGVFYTFLLKSAPHTQILTPTTAGVNSKALLFSLQRQMDHNLACLFWNLLYCYKLYLAVFPCKYIFCFVLDAVTLTTTVDLDYDL